MAGIDHHPVLNSLPLAPFKGDFLARLRDGPLLLEAEPGAGKSTLAPLWVLDATPSDKTVWLVQPRVLAAKSLASRLASLLGEKPGAQVGYQIPFERVVGTDTRLVVMTPGILLQRLLHDPLLDNVATVMLDEVHERALHQDFAWALLKEAAILRDDLQLVLMSATPDPVLSSQISNRLFAEGRCFPVSIDYQTPLQRNDRYGESIAEQVVRALAGAPGSRDETTLVFLPGWREIDDCAKALTSAMPQLPVFRLHSQVEQTEQQRAIDPASGARIILSTNIAETSLTIADVTRVIDSGLARVASFEQRTGISRLSTRMISQASARQRTGRAGRVRAGHCIRLWSVDQPLAPADLPEIRNADYVPLALMMAHWGAQINDLEWLEPPNALAFHEAKKALQRWQFIDERGGITDAGRLVSQLGTHPRIAALLMMGSDHNRLPQPVLSLALALHFDIAATDDPQQWLSNIERDLSRQSQWRTISQRWLKALALTVERSPWNSARIAPVFYDRIGFRQTSGRYRVNSGISIEPLNRLDSEWAIFPTFQGRAKSHVGAGFALALSSKQMADLGEVEAELIFHKQRWCWRNRRIMGGAAIDEAIAPVAGDELSVALASAIRAGDLKLIWSGKVESLLRRARTLVDTGVIQTSPLDEEALMASLDTWLQPFLDERVTPDSLPLLAALESRLGYDVCRTIEREFPAQITLPGGRPVTVVFADDGTAEISAKLQEFFGCQSLLLAGGRIPLRIKLLSPNGSPLALTSDLASFWKQGYPDVRKDMRGRYPRHPWPEDPLAHQPTSLTNRRLREQAGEGKT